MSQKEKKRCTTNLRLTTIVYREGEWSPELLQKEVRDRYRYYKIPEYADQFQDTMLQNNIDPRTVLYIAATDASLRVAQAAGLAVLGYARPRHSVELRCKELPDRLDNTEMNDADSLSGVRTLVEGFEEVDAPFLERVFEREHHLPWEIARTNRWVLREFTMDDMDGLIKLYDQPGVAYRIVNGYEVPGYIEPLLPREEEEEYQRCYIENMYGFYGYGMWIVTENTDIYDAGLPCEGKACMGDQKKDRGNSPECLPRIIGRAGLENREYEDGVELEMGYVIDLRWQRQGIAYEVCSAIMEYARENTDFPRLNALTEADNTASIALLEKLGFTYMEDTDVSGSVTRRYVYNLRDVS